MTIVCDKCDGYGTDQDDWDEWCDKCDGTGEIEEDEYYD